VTFGAREVHFEMPFGSLAPYRMPARDEDAELEALVDHDGLDRALSRHRRRAIVALVVGITGLFGSMLAVAAADDVLALRRFRGAAEEPALTSRNAMVVPPRLAASTALAVRELAWSTSDPTAFIALSGDAID
jgi:hypothetical protein